MTPSDFLTLKNIYLDAKIVTLSALESYGKKTSFCIMVANVTRSRRSHIQTAQDVFDFLKGPDPYKNIL